MDISFEKATIQPTLYRDICSFEYQQFLPTGTTHYPFQVPPTSLTLFLLNTSFFIFYIFFESLDFWCSTNVVFLGPWDISTYGGKVSDENKNIILTDFILWSLLPYVFIKLLQELIHPWSLNFQIIQSIAPPLTFLLYCLLKVLFSHPPTLLNLTCLKYNMCLFQDQFSLEFIILSEKLFFSTITWL